MNADLKDWLLSILSVSLLPADRMHEAFDNLLVQHVPGVDTTRFKRYIRSKWRNGIPTEERSVYRLFDQDKQCG